MKKLLSFFGTIAILSTFLISVVPVSAEFTDIDQATAPNDASGYFDAVRFVERAGIVDGYPDGSYKPQQRINRAEFTKIIINTHFSAESINNCSTSSLTFSDVSKDAWFAKYVCKAVKEGIIEGYPDGTFKPAQNISFVEAAKIIAVASIQSSNSPALNSSTPWYRAYVEYLESQQAIPVDITTFEHPITRGEMAEIIYRVLEKPVSKSSNSYLGIAINSNQSQDPGLKVGDKKGAFTLSQIDRGQVLDTYKFTGTTTITGTFNHHNEDDYIVGSVCISELTADSIPKIPTLLLPEDPSFCFPVDDKITQAFGGVGARGRATFTIDGYKTNIIKAEVGGIFDSSNFVKIDKIHSQLLSVDNQWSELLHYDDQFYIKVPKQAAGSDCVVVDNDPAQRYFSPETDQEEITVFTNERSNTTYLATEFSTILEGGEETEGGYLYKECQNDFNDFKRLSTRKPSLTSYDIEPGWVIYSEPVNNDQELDAFLKKHYGSGCSLGAKTPADNNQEGVYEVGINGDGKDLGETACPINFSLKVYYSPNLNRAVTWAIGQDATFWDEKYEQAYDQAMIASFHFLEQ